MRLALAVRGEGRGVTIVARESAKHVGFDIKGRKSPSKVGNVGSVPPRSSEIGARIVGVTDWKGGVYNPKA